ncbi:hypothetical protein DEO72_LG4g2596 [Vigna unguiculata]|uniref:Uncharacterized protein n=1 Tax=Vigna unguiculata TaxID=3917 RepID=A0A4D6LRK9_VIGUN|nr:hypothetical protein DEO72_LG4g2596 [Vigna unguiculata]
MRLVTDSFTSRPSAKQWSLISWLHRGPLQSNGHRFLYIKTLSFGMVIDSLCHIETLSVRMVVDSYRPSPMGWSLISVWSHHDPLQEESEAGKRTPRRRRGRRRFGASNCRVWSRDVGGSSRSVAGAVVANHRGYDSHLARGRRSEKGDDSQSWFLAGDASVGGWCRRRRASPSVGLAAATRAPGIVVARGKWRKGLARDGEERKKGDAWPPASSPASSPTSLVRRGRGGSGVLVVGGQGPISLFNFKKEEERGVSTVAGCRRRARRAAAWWQGEQTRVPTAGVALMVSRRRRSVR